LPELPDIRLYLHALESRTLGARLMELRVLRPFLLRSVTPEPRELAGRTVVSLERLGKRIVFGLEDEYYIVIHLMIAGRFRWATANPKAPGKIGLAALEFTTGTLLLTEAGTKRRASLHLVQGRSGLDQFRRGGLEVETSTLAEFARVMRAENHTLKRSLTDPRILDGVGNAYSDELLHRARLSPLALTSRLNDEEMERLWQAARDTLRQWTDRLIQDTGEAFPEKVTAFRPGMAVHGRYGEPCPVCGTPVQRIRYAENETNYCPTCQTGGRLLADRALSRLLRQDWPRTLEELEELRSPKP
jgi:formamidopyrimidine-DNA glycosylase